MLSTASYIRRMWSFSRALDLALVDEEIEQSFKVPIGQRHGERVGYIALCIGKELGLSRKDLVNLIVAGLLHDIGAVGGFRQFHGDPRLVLEHCIVGSAIVTRLRDGDVLKPLIKLHHETPEPSRGIFGITDIPILAKIVSLADKVDVVLDRILAPYQEREKIKAWVWENRGSLFYPEVSDVFLKVAGRESFWIDLVQTNLLDISLEMLFGQNIEVFKYVEDDEDLTKELALTFADLIDQKSSFTATHSHSVSLIASKIAEQLQWESYRIKEIEVAALLHDLGKLAIPKKVLDKPAALEGEEIAQIRTHTYYTYRLLTDACFPQHMVKWAAYHHERLDGKGYPFGVSEIDLDIGTRIMTISDIFAALTEDRPYRKAMNSNEAFNIISKGIGINIDAKLFEVAKIALS